MVSKNPPWIAEGSSLGRGTLRLVSRFVVTVVANAAYLVILARLVQNAQVFGNIAILQIFETLAIILASFALPSAAIRFISMLHGRREDQSALIAQQKILQIGLILSISAGMLTFLFANYFSLILIGTYSGVLYFKVLSVDIIFLMFSSFLTIPYYVKESYVYLSSVQMIDAVLSASLSVLLFVLFRNIESVLIGWILGDIIAVSLLLYRLPKTKSTKKFVPWKTLIKDATQLDTVAILGYFSNYWDRYVLIGYMGSFALGLYTPIISTVTYITGILGTVNQAILPRLSRKFGENGIASTRNSFFLLSRYLHFIGIPMGLGIAALSYPILMLFGGQYTAGYNSLAFIAFVLGLTVAGATYGSVLLSSGLVKHIVISYIISLPLSLVVALITVNSIGILGIAIGRSLLFALQFLYPLIILRIKYGFSIDLHSFAYALIASLPMILVLIVMQEIVLSVFALPIYVLGGMGVYLFSLRSLRAINENDFAFLTSILPKRLKWVIKLVYRQRRFELK